METTQTTDQDRYIKYLVNAGHDYEKKRDYKSACLFYETAMNAFLNKENADLPLKEVLTYLETSKTFFEDSWGQILAHWLTLQTKSNNHSKTVKKEELDQKIASLSNHAIATGNLHSPQASWIFSHHAFCSLQSSLLDGNFKNKPHLKKLERLELELVLATLCHMDNAWAMAQLGDLYRYMAIGTKLFFGGMLGKRERYYTQSLLCFQMIIPTLDPSDTGLLNHYDFPKNIVLAKLQDTGQAQPSSLQKQHEAWLYSHAAAAICNARLESHYKTAKQLLEAALKDLKNASYGETNYYWALQYQGVAKLLSAASSPLDFVSATEDLIDSLNSFIVSISKLPSPILDNIDPIGKISVNIVEGTIICFLESLLKRIEDVSSISKNDLLVLNVLKTMSGNYLGKYINQDGTFFRDFVEFDTLLKIAFAASVGVIINQLELNFESTNPSSTTQSDKQATRQTIDSWNQKALKTVGDVMSLSLKIVTSQDTNNSLEGDGNGDMFFLWKSNFFDKFKTKEEQMLFVAEVVYFLMHLPTLKNLHKEVPSEPLGLEPFANYNNFLNSIFGVFKGVMDSPKDETSPEDELYKTYTQLGEQGILYQVYNQYFKEKSDSTSWITYKSNVTTILKDCNHCWALSYMQQFNDPAGILSPEVNSVASSTNVNSKEPPSKIFPRPFLHNLIFGQSTLSPINF